MLIQQILVLGARLHVGPPLGLVSITQRRLDTRHNVLRRIMCVHGEIYENLQRTV